MEEMQMKLKPIKTGKYWDQILVYTKIKDTAEWYPTSLWHIDTFWQGAKENPGIYSMLNGGNTVYLQLKMYIDDDGDN